MALNNFLLSFLLHLGLLLPATADQQSIYAVAGNSVTLSCPGIPPNHKSWMHNGKLVYSYMGKWWKVDPTFKGTLNADSSLVIPEAEEGTYTCDVSGQTTSFHLRVLRVTGSPEGYLLQGERLDMQLHLPDQEGTTVEWIDPHDKKGNQPRWSLTDNNKKLSIKDLQLQDNGIWKCTVRDHIIPSNVRELTIPYNVTVIGFRSPSDEEIFAAVNSTVTLSYRLNVNPEQKNYLNRVEVLLTRKTSEMPVSLNVSSSFPLKKIFNVQLEDAGRYQCRLTFSRGNLNKTICLVVMEVVAMPQGPLEKGEEARLCCNISPPLSPGALLRWDSVNESRDSSHCLTVRTAGLWTCSLVVKGEVKISMNYTVEDSTGQTQFPVMEVAMGAGVPLLLLILISVCLYTYVTVKRRKQRAERMAQAKQHLLEKRTCQCQREISNDYYHT